MEDLPEDVRLEIFSHLPPEPVLKCKLVSKTWENLLSHKKVGLLFLVAVPEERNLQLFYADYSEIFSRASSGEKLCYKSLTKINHPVINHRRKQVWVDQIVNSCNGLVCLRIPHHKVNDPVYIFNPATTEYINLPRMKHKFGYVVSGFGYHPLTDEYKVIRIHYPNREFDHVQVPKGYVEVYTLGRDTQRGWRSFGEVPYMFSKRGVLANGSLYWLDYAQNRIVAFDLADEEFRLLPSMPPCFNGIRLARYLIKVLGGNLCLVYSGWDHSMDIWSYKRREMKKNVKEDEEDYHQPWSWSLEFSIPSSINTNAYLFEPFALTRNKDLLLWNESSLFRYDTKTEEMEKIVDENFNEFRTFQGIPHMNSYLSMKSLGGKVRPKRVGTKKKKMPEVNKIIVDD